MDFLNQIENENNKDDNSIFTFNDKNDTAQKNNSLPFPFCSQSSTGGGGDIMFLNSDMKADGNESFSLSHLGNDTQNINNNNNFCGLDFLNTICEVPESTNNNLFSSQNDNTFLVGNIAQNQSGLDFIKEDNEKEDENENNNFDFTKFQNNNNEEPINVDINNLFKSSKTKNNDFFGKSSKTRKNENFELNNLLNTSSNDNTNVKENGDSRINQINTDTFKKNLNNNIMNNNIVNTVKDQINNSDIEQNSNINNSQINNFILNPNSNSNINYYKKSPNKSNNSPISDNKEKINSTNNNNVNINSSTLSGTSSNSNTNLNYNIKETTPSFSNISIKPTMNNKVQKLNLDDIDKIISLNSKINGNIKNIQNNILPINQNLFQGKPDNNDIKKLNLDLGKENLKNLSNEISSIFNSTLINGKRTEIEPKDKDLPNIDNLLNFTKENITSMPNTKMNNKNVNIIEDKNNKNLIKKVNDSQSQYFSRNGPKTNSAMIKTLPGDSFDKKSQLIKLDKNEVISPPQVDNSSKNNFPEDGKSKAIPSKLEMIQKYNDIAMRLNRIREKAKEYRNLGPYFSQLITANENYNIAYPSALKKMLEEYNDKTSRLLNLMKLKNNKMTEMNNKFYEEIKKYSLAFPGKI